MSTIFTPFTDPIVVATTLKPLTDILIPALRIGCKRSATYFAANGWTIEPGLHSFMTRHRVLQILKQRSINAIEDPGMDSAYSATGQSLCGVVISTPSCKLRLLKNTGGRQELPGASTKNRESFYQSNLDLGWSDESTDPKPLSLVAMWSTDINYELGSFALVCPYGIDDNKPQDKWWLDLAIKGASDETIEEPEPELEQITARQSDSIDTTAPQGNTDVEDDELSDQPL